MLSLFEHRVGWGKYIPLASDPYIKGWQQKDAHYKSRDQTSDDDDREWAL
jgi:hypothetical protein